MTTSAGPYVLPEKFEDVFTAEIERDFARLRQQGPLARATFPFGGDGWIATRYDACRTILNDERFGVEITGSGDYPRVRKYESGGAASGTGMVNFALMDGKKHTEHRAPLARHLTVKRVLALRPATEEIVGRLLDILEERGQPAEMVAGFTRAVPVWVLCHLLGVPPEESDEFIGYAAPLSSGLVTDPDELAYLFGQIAKYLHGLVDRRRKNPSDDLISALVQDTEAGNVWSEEEMYGIGMLLLGAGHDATAAILGGITNILAHSPDTFRALADDPDRIPTAIEEFLRILPVGLAGTRTRVALEDVVVGDTLVRQGEGVLTIMHAANFDESVFENSDQLVLDRHPNNHMGFGFGPHGCPGSQLARMEMDVAVRALVRRFATFSAAEPDENWFEKTWLRGPKSLLATWT